MKTASINKVIEAFFKGEELKTSNESLSSIKSGSMVYLVGYKWAKYADIGQGITMFYTGWRGYSPTTSKHINKAISWAKLANQKYIEAPTRPSF